MMSLYRQLKNGEFDTTDLDVHLEQCASCRQTLARDMFIGEQVRALPVLETPPDMHAKVMRALAQEQTEFLKKAAPGSVSTPEFLKPYLHDSAQSMQSSHAVSSFSSAETGPLPVIHARRRKNRPRSHMSQFAVLGVAAMFLMVLMMGGVTSLLLLAKGSATHLAHISNTTSNLLTRIDIQKTTYTTATSYTRIASAVADRNAIYYTAYQDGTTPAWMLLQMERATRTSTPLLAQPGGQAMILLGSNAQWVVWLQYDDPVVHPYKNNPTGNQKQVLSPWSLRVLPLAQVAQATSPITPTVLLKGTFDQQTVPTWVHTPVQGIWLAQNVLLVATIDENGKSHLLEYQLDLASKPAMTEIAAATLDHLISSPTTNSDATEIYWADEWISDTGVLNSNILMQQETDAPGIMRPSHGRWMGYPAQIIKQGSFRTDGMSFRPQIADNMLFWLSAAPVSNAPTGTPTTGSTSTPVATTTPQISTSLIPRTDNSIYAPALDASVLGQVLMLPLDSDALTTPVSLNNTGPAYALQVGSDFALWQGDKGYEMFDVPTENDVTTGNVLNDAAFLAVNGDSAVWTSDAAPNVTTSSNSALTTTNLFTFDWPK